MEESRVFQAHLRELDGIMSWSRNFLQKIKLSEKKQNQFELAIEEAIVNIISYAYEHPPGLLELNFVKDSDSSQVRLTIKDQGLPFNPIENQRKVDISAPIEERKVGGLGIYFIQELMDSVNYERLDDSNVLTLSKDI